MNSLLRSLSIASALLIAKSEGHRDAPSSAVAESSDESFTYSFKRDHGGRRTIFRQNLAHEYEGIPIEFPTDSRRHLQDNEVEVEGGLQVVNIESTATAVKDSRITTLKTSTESSTSTINANSPTSPEPRLDRRYRRIFNPDELAAVEDYPFMAALLVNGELWCGAAVIARDALLTAAHCLQLQYNNRFYREYVKMLTVRVGSSNATSGGEVVRVSEIFFHPNYKPNTLEFNVALLKVHKNMTFGKEEPRIDMIEYSRSRVVPIDKKILFLGWGSVLGDAGNGGQVLLQQLELPIYDLADCQEVYGKELVTRNNFCAGYISLPKNVCNHDAGGPALMDGVLIGILSFSSKRCDVTDQPAVFTTVGATVPWLETIGESKNLPIVRNIVIPKV